MWGVNAFLGSDLGWVLENLKFGLLSWISCFGTFSLVGNHDKSVVQLKFFHLMNSLFRDWISRLGTNLVNYGNCFAYASYITAIANSNYLANEQEFKLETSTLLEPLFRNAFMSSLYINSNQLHTYLYFASRPVYETPQASTQFSVKAAFKQQHCKPLPGHCNQSL